MIGLDTNVIVRYITLDDPKQTALAVKLIESLSTDAPGFISLVVLAELAWVLEVSYSFNKVAVIRVFDGLLHSKELVIEQVPVVAQALDRFRMGNAGFSDYLIERGGQAAGCAHTMTFDQRAANSAGMRLLE
jgi:predicted nucleic-acid-binding protein